MPGTRATAPDAVPARVAALDMKLSRPLAGVPATAPFPCPFCRGTRVNAVDQGRVLAHYRCVTCAESWTAMRHAQPPEAGAAQTTHSAVCAPGRAVLPRNSSF